MAKDYICENGSDSACDAKSNTQQDQNPGFIGSVLLTHESWDKGKFIQHMRESWGIEIDESDEGESDRHEGECGCGCHDSKDDCCGNHHSHHTQDETCGCGCDHGAHERKAHNAHDSHIHRDHDRNSHDCSAHGETCCEYEDEHLFDDSVYANVGNLTLVVTMMPLPIPNGEAEYYAGANFMWKDAVEHVKKHRAHILIAVMGEGSAIEKATLFTKAAESCLHFGGAIGVYSDGAVLESQMYMDFANMLKQNQLCIPLWVWFGLYFADDKVVIYTYGMHKFGKDEMEFLIENEHQEDSEFLNAARYYLMDIADYVIASDVTLNEGETLGISQDHHILIQKREGIAVDGMTLQMEYRPAS